MSDHINTMASIALSSDGHQYFGLGESNQPPLMMKDVAGMSGATKANATETLDTYTNYKAE